MKVEPLGAQDSVSSFSWVSVKSAFDKQAKEHSATFEGFCEWLFSGAHKLAKGAEKTKLRTPAFSPVVLLPNEKTLEGASVYQITAMAIDFDGTQAKAICRGTGAEAKVVVLREPIKIDLPALAKAILALGISAALYETASSTPEFPRVRLVVPLDAPIAPDKLPSAFASFIGALPCLEWVDIPTSTRTAGIHFVPMLPKDDYFALVTPGKRFAPDLDAEPVAQPQPIGLAEARHKMRDEWEKSGVQIFDPRDLEGSGWMRRYPIDWKTLDLHSLFKEDLGVEIEDRSRPHKGNGKKWRCQCPLFHEHSKPSASLDSVVFVEDDGYPGFYCPHQHELSLRHLVMGTEDGTPAVITEDMLLKHAEKWVSPMAREAKARKIEPSAIWHYQHASAPGERMESVRLLSSRILKWDVKRNKAGVETSRKLIKDTYNLDKIFQHDVLFDDLRYDLFKQAPVWKGESIPATAIDTVMSDLRSYIVENYNGVCFASTALLEAFVAEANRRPFHPVYDYLVGLEWDGVSRIAQVPQKINAIPGPLVPEYLRCFFVGAVARVLYMPGPHAKNGAKLDTCLVLQSDFQGVGKTTFFQTLVPHEDWFGSEAVGELERDALLVVHRHWLHEMGEVDALHRKHEAERLKNFMSQTQDTFRLPYGRATGTFPRRFALCGSTNRAEHLEDDTGSRRWHILQVRDADFDLAWIRANRDQIWAEAVHLYKDGTKWWLDRDLNKIHEEYASQFLNTNSVMVDALMKFLDKMDENKQQIFEHSTLTAYLQDEIHENMHHRGASTAIGMAFSRVNAFRTLNGLPKWTKKKNIRSTYYELDKFLLPA